MKKIKTLLIKARDKTINTLADIMVECPNLSMAVLLANIAIILALFFSSGSDVPLNLND